MLLHWALLFLFLRFMYFTRKSELQREEKRQRQIFHPLSHIPYGHRGQRESGSGNFIQVSHVSGSYTSSWTTMWSSQGLGTTSIWNARITGTSFMGHTTIPASFLETMIWNILLLLKMLMNVNVFKNYHLSEEEKTQTAFISKSS